MPKLNFKKHKKEKKEKKEKKKEKRKDKYRPPKLYEDDEGWTPSESSCKSEQSEWQERLFEAMMDDEGQDPFYSNYQPSAYERMTDEEHRQYIVDGIYKKKNSEKIEMEKQKEKRRKQKERQARELEKEMEKKHQESLRQEQEIRAKYAQEEYNAKWKQLESLKAINYRDIPWPVINRKFTVDSVRSFMLCGSSDEEIKKKLRQEQIRYHPDKFMTRIMSRFEGSEKDRETVLSRMNEVSGWLNEIWKSRSE